MFTFYRASLNSLSVLKVGFLAIFFVILIMTTLLGAPPPLIYPPFLIFNLRGDSYLKQDGEIQIVSGFSELFKLCLFATKL